MPASVFQTGIAISDLDRAEGCYVLYDGGDAHAVLIDMNGDEVRVWDYSGSPPEIIDPELAGGAKGHLLAQKEHDRFANRQGNTTRGRRRPDARAHGFS